MATKPPIYIYIYFHHILGIIEWFPIYYMKIKFMATSYHQPVIYGRSRWSGNDLGQKILTVTSPDVPRQRPGRTRRSTWRADLGEIVEDHGGFHGDVWWTKMVMTWDFNGNLMGLDGDSMGFNWEIIIAESSCTAKVNSLLCGDISN